jgi:hypothetical protein
LTCSSNWAALGGIMVFGSVMQWRATRGKSFLVPTRLPHQLFMQIPMVCAQTSGFGPKGEILSYMARSDHFRRVPTSSDDHVTFAFMKEPTNISLSPSLAVRPLRSPPTLSPTFVILSANHPGPYPRLRILSVTTSSILWRSLRHVAETIIVADTILVAAFLWLLQ